MWFEIPAGKNLEEACKLAIAECEATEGPIWFELSGTIICVVAGMSLETASRSWLAARIIGRKCTDDLGWPLAIADLECRINEWRKEVMGTLSQTQTLVTQLQQQVQQILTILQQLGTDFQTLSTDVTTLIQDYQNQGGGNGQLIETINNNLQAIQTSLASVQTGLTSTDAAITGEDSTVEGAIDPPPAGGSSPASTGGAKPAGSSSGSGTQTAPPATQAAQKAPASSAQGPLHGSK